jgi:hypothetical protein
MRGGFHAFVGNPPWVSYAGRAAQPLREATRSYYVEFYEAFAGYRNLQGLFVERCARLLSGSGRIGLVIPSSMSEQEGYGPTRLAHDRRCVCDNDLPDFGEDAFVGVFQPCMLLRSTKRPKEISLEEAERWPIERPDLDLAARTLLAKMDRPPLPAELFGERGLQSSGVDTDHLADHQDALHAIAMRVGGDIEPFLRKSPSQFAEPTWFAGRLRSPKEWADVRVLIRQTARFPMAALSDGVAFRNSILAGFATKEYPAGFLVAYLNSTPIRWLHYIRNRDARQGMPQMKVGHLRSIPAPPSDALVAALEELGHKFSKRNIGASEDEQARIDMLVADAFDLTGDERQRQTSWAKEV